MVNIHSSNYDPQGFNYDTFMHMITPKLVPQLKLEMLKKKVIYEIKGVRIQIANEVQNILYELF